MASPENAAVQEEQIVTGPNGEVLGKIVNGKFIPDATAVNNAGQGTIDSVPAAAAQSEVGKTALENANAKADIIDGKSIVDSLTPEQLVLVGSAATVAVLVTIWGFVAALRSSTFVKKQN